MRELTRRALAAAGLLGVAVAAACASAGSPPGGPPDEQAPQVVDFDPDSGTVNFSGRAVVITFDETINDRGTGASALEALVLISPRDGSPQVAWSRSRIAVRPHGGWRPNTAYTVTLLPGIADLRGNVTRGSRSIVFSTGAEIPAGLIAGRTFDWPTQRLATRAYIEAVRAADSAIFVASVDSGGTYAVGPLGPGEYLVRGYVDQNNNRVLDRTETWDSTRVTVAAGPRRDVELLLIQRDTFPARILNVTVLDTLTLGVEFDKALDPAQRFGPEMIRVAREDSTAIPVTAVVTRAAHDSARLAAQRAADTTRRTPPAPARDTAAARDTTPQPPRPSRPAPPTTLVVQLGAPLAPGNSYRVSASGVRTIMGRSAPSSRVITLPRAAAPAAPPTDTTRAAPPDTGRAAPPAAPRASRP